MPHAAWTVCGRAWRLICSWCNSYEGSVMSIPHLAFTLVLVVVLDLAMPAAAQSPPPQSSVSPASVDTLLIAGDVLFEQELFDKALVKYQQAESQDASDLRVQFRLAKVYARFGNRTAGLASLDRIIATKPHLKDNADLAGLRNNLESLSVPPSASAHTDGSKQAADALTADRAMTLLALARAADGSASLRIKLAAEAREELAVSLNDPDQANLDVWRAAGVIASLQEDDDLAAFVVEAISRLKPDCHQDPRLQHLMTTLNERPIKEKLKHIAKNRSRALKHLNAARSGDVSCMFNIAMDYEYGIGVVQDVVAAVQWYQRAADSGDLESKRALGEAMCNLGTAYLEGGLGRMQDDAKAAYWFRKATDVGVAGAMNSLGYLYASGRGVPKDETKAVQLYAAGANAGSARAISNLAHAYWTGQGGLPRDRARAVALLQTAADFGIPEAMVTLGVANEYGEGVEACNAEIAVHWYRKAAETGMAAAMFNLGRACANGIGGLSKDEGAAVEWYRKAARAGDEEARQLLRGTGYSW